MPSSTCAASYCESFLFATANDYYPETGTPCGTPEGVRSGNAGNDDPGYFFAGFFFFGFTFHSP